MIRMESISLKMILRSWWRNRLFSTISLISLAIGIACTNMLISYVIYESGIESGNPNSSNIVYMSQDSPMTSGQRVSFIVGDIPAQIKDRYPEVDDYLRLGMSDCSAVCIEDKQYGSLSILNADPSLPKFFPYRVIMGDLNRAITEPNCIALTERIAKRLFNTESPIGKSFTVKLSNNNRSINYEVTAVIEEYPQAILKFDAITGTGSEYYGGITMLLVNGKFDIDGFADKLKADKIPTLQGNIGRYYFNNLQESYFQQDSYTQESIPYIHRNQKELLYIGLLSAILILAIGCFNYANLNLSRVIKQMRMIYTQRVMGASNIEIHRQLFLDTFLMVVAAFMLSLLITLDLLPTFNQTVSGRITISFFFSGKVLPVIMLLVLFLSIVPSLYMSHKINSLSHSDYRLMSAGKGKQGIISILSIAQFAIAIGLLFATITAHRQLNLTKFNGNRYRGLIEVWDWSGKYLDRFANEIERLPQIKEWCLSKSSVINFSMRQIIMRDENDNELYYSLAEYGGDSRMLDILRVDIKSGMSVDEAMIRFNRPVYINQRYAELMIPKGENPVGKPVRMFDADFGAMEKNDSPTAMIAGIVENLYTGTLRQEVYPSLSFISNEAPYYVMHIRLDDNSLGEELKLLKESWDRVCPEAQFTYQDVYSSFMAANRKTTELAGLLTMYSMISLLLTAFGLFGISLYAVEQRTKEIGIRKVNGARTIEVMILLNSRFIKWSAIAFCIAAPITWLALSEWLENFVYRVQISPLICLLSGLIVLLIIVLTVSWHSYRAAASDPVKALRSE